MSEKTGYEKIAQTKDYYLEDSFVLGIIFNTKQVSIRLDLVLTEPHPLYSTPRPGEQYCYRKGDLIFTRIADMSLRFQSVSGSVDADGEVDLGNIDSFYLLDGAYHLAGDWGALEIRAEQLAVVLDS